VKKRKSKRGLKSWSRENSLGDNPLTLKNPTQTSQLNEAVKIRAIYITFFTFFSFIFLHFLTKLTSAVHHRVKRLFSLQVNLLLINAHRNQITKSNCLKTEYKITAMLCMLVTHTPTLHYDNSNTCNISSLL
jgi:hypothetical protein